MKPKIETVDDLCENLADYIGVYGCCKSTNPNGCDNESLFCCRVGFTMVMRERVVNSVEVDEMVSRYDLNMSNNKYDKKILEFLRDE